MDLFYKNINFEIKIKVKNHAPDEIFLIWPVANFKDTYVRKPKAIPSAIEKDKGIITIITSAGSNSTVDDQFNFSMPPSISIATYISAPEVAYAAIIAARGHKNIAKMNNAPTTIAVNPVLPPASTPAELST